jgi:UDP-N-acetyl-D-mannosaminuronic acid dehydrogenase
MNPTVTESVGRQNYRLPPAKMGTYLVFRRGMATFCVRSTEVSAVLSVEQAHQLNGLPFDDRRYSDFHDLSLPVVDVAFIMGATPNLANIKTSLVALATEPATYVAIDEILTVQQFGEELNETALDEMISDLILIEGESVPLIDVWAASLWAQSQELGREIRKVVPILDDPVLEDPESDPLLGDVPRAHFDEFGKEFVQQFHLIDETPPVADKLFDVCVVGGLGHVGLPLGLSLADADKKVVLYDLNEESLRTVSRGRMPFLEEGAEEVLQRHLNHNLKVTADREAISQSYFIVIVIGTPVDEHLNPKFSTFKRFIDDILDCIHDDQHLILRSTVFPGTTEKVQAYLASRGKRPRISFCPERIIQGKAMEELQNLPQIVSGFEPETVNEAKELFLHLTDTVLELSPIEAELGKLFANVWRYVNFAISNQFYQIAAANDVDYYRVHHALTENYPRLKGLNTPGFSAGPCLFKDTMQLAAFSNNNFFLGHAAMLINEGLPNFVVQTLKSKYPLDDMTVGLLGMAFKPDNDDKRSSLSYKLRKILDIEAKAVFCADTYIDDESFLDPNELVLRSDIVVVATPHSEYAELTIDDSKILVDVWNFYGKGGLF